MREWVRFLSTDFTGYEREAVGVGGCRSSSQGRSAGFIRRFGALERGCCGCRKFCAARHHSDNYVGQPPIKCGQQTPPQPPPLSFLYAGNSRQTRQVLQTKAVWISAPHGRRGCDQIGFRGPDSRSGRSGDCPGSQPRSAAAPSLGRAELIRVPR